MRLILAGNNKKKLSEMKSVFADMEIELVSQSEAGLCLEADETGRSFEENAFIKANVACEALGNPAIADDSGLVVDALGGDPGVHSARYGGVGCRDDNDRIALLLRNMEGKTERTAKFVSCIACVFPNGDIITARGECKGEILRIPRGTGGFGYDSVFEPEGKGRTMAELTAEEKNEVSHRGKAVRDFKAKLRKYYADK